MSFNIDNLKESNEFLNILLENITCAIFLADKDYNIQNFNNSFGLLFHKSKDKVLRVGVGNIIGCEHIEGSKAKCGTTKNCENCILAQSLSETFKTKKSLNKQVLARNFFINNTKIYKFFSFSVKPITYNNEEMALVSIEDITELELQKEKLKDQNEKFEKLNDLKNEFLGIAAHDLRSPIGAVQTFLQILLRAEKDKKIEDYRELLFEIYGTIDSSLNLLNELLDISKIEAGKLELKKEKVDYSEIVKKEIKMCSLLSKEKNISIKLEEKEKIPLLPIDKVRIRQVLNNLLSNAIKYSPINSSVKIKLSIEDHFICTKIIDKGKGIPESDIPFVFETYQTSKSKPVGKGKTTGLGLAIVKNIVEKHKGIVGVKSTADKGSIFYFSLPLG